MNSPGPLRADGITDTWTLFGRRLDGVAQDGLAGLDVTGTHRNEAFAQQGLRELLVRLDPALHDFLEFPPCRRSAPLSAVGAFCPWYKAQMRARRAGRTTTAREFGTVGNGLCYG
jgi:hypothetical protein